jgi:hypothetical protein
VLLGNYLFTIWNLRKLYAEKLEFNYHSFALGLGCYFLREEGRLTSTSSRRRALLGAVALATDRPPIA